MLINLLGMENVRTFRYIFFWYSLSSLVIILLLCGTFQIFFKLKILGINFNFSLCKLSHMRTFFCYKIILKISLSIYSQINLFKFNIYYIINKYTSIFILSRYIIYNYMDITNIVIEMFIIYICILLHDFARTNSQRNIFCREPSLSELESLFLVIRLKAFLSHGSVSYYCNGISGSFPFFSNPSFPPIAIVSSRLSRRSRKGIIWKRGKSL